MKRAGALKPVLIVLAVLCAPVVIMVIPLVYNYHMAPLARLSRRVPVGSDCAAAGRAFAAYYERRRAHGNDDVQHADGSTVDNAAFDDVMPPRRMLSLYDVTLFGDVQMEIICDPAGRRVERVFYVGD